ncbi:hypothetical protein F5984_13760 [Rudanella paleaurantiibacter]|uniref:Uncharacterized protein n=1 Tax=Rudanella paleaurantiibacter TaxID=2614655 RepID=A0A7J5TYP6_9BACT|nr:hypothetical protein [Rudanella paleaurantiibacter]KAB7730234.1 hypothetical protein F5984_13760 [Rudanella paleaurantiibacter]
MYNFEQHLHNYSVWTAARAAQRGYASTATIKAAIENSELRQYAENGLSDRESFNAFHRRCANDLIHHLSREVGREATYGRAAKIISIYLKTSVILTNKAGCERSKFIHPPIDRILLRRIAEHTKIRKYQKMNWTRLDEVSYWKLVDELSNLFGKFDWSLEEFWSPERE